MTELAEFLLARIAEDEEVAAWAQAHQEGRVERWEVHSHTAPGGVRSPIVTLRGRPDLRVATGLAHVDAAKLIARFDPARVLIECEAKRRIVEQSQVLGRHGSGRVVAPELKWVLATLALPYADHPDYREEWRP